MDINNLSGSILRVFDGQHELFIDPLEVLMITRQDRCTHIHTFDMVQRKLHVVACHKDLCKFEHELPCYFFRSQRSYLINVFQVRSIDCYNRVSFGLPQGPTGRISRNDRQAFGILQKKLYGQMNHLAVLSLQIRVAFMNRL